MANVAEDRAWLSDVSTFLSAPVPSEVRARGAQVVADVLAATVAGAAVPANEAVTQSMPLGRGDASVVGTARTTAPGHAALLNGTASISQEIEEGHNTGGHVGAGVVVGGFALAEHADADGETLVEGVVRAYELCARIENAVFLMKDQMNEALPWLVRDPHSTWTTLGPAVAGAIALGADDDQVMEAFRLGANLAVVSMWDPYREGTPARNYTAGFSAQAGVDAALLAVSGLEGSRVSMHHVYDPLREMKGEAFDRSFAELGSQWEIQRNYYKFAPSCRYTHPPLGALEELADEVRVTDVESIDVYTYRNACDLDYTDYDNLTSGKFSIPYVLARYLTSGAFWLDDFDDDAVSNPDVRALAERVHLHHDEAYEETFPEHWSARVAVTHIDGQTVEAECIDPPGDYRNFPGTDALREKWRRLLAYRLDDSDTAFDALCSVRERDARDVGAALRLDG
jgi:2-methylcitrate dehydratase PrpD